MGPTMKYLVVVLVVAVVVWMLTARARGGRAAPPPATPPKPGARDGKQATQIVGCAHCGVHLPESDALSAGKLHYCSEAHRALGPPA
jgi:uncharacterized protein